MKRIVSLLLALSIMLCFTSAFAAGKVKVDNENFHVVDNYTIYGYAYARVSNAGDKPIKVNAGLLEIFDENGDTLTSKDYLNTFAEYLQPGEYTYVYAYEKVDVETTSDVSDYMLTISGKSDSSKTSVRLQTEPSWMPNVTKGYWSYNYMVATVTNNTEETLFDITVVLVLLDDNDNILYIDTSSLYSDKGLTPGSSIVVREDVPSKWMNYYASAGYVPTKVDSIAYVNIDSK